MWNKLSKAGAKSIAKHEGFRNRAYRCPAGVLTIGIGFTWQSVAFREWWYHNRKTRFDENAMMTKKDALACLAFLVEHEYGERVNTFLGKEVPQNVFDAMVSMVFNCGPGSLKWKWAKAAKEGNYALAAQRMKVTAVTARGKRLQGLVNRRKDEANLMRWGKYV